MKYHFLDFIAGGLALHVIAWIEIVEVIILISFIEKKFHVSYIFFMLHVFSFSSLSVILGWRERWVRRSHHLYCLVQFILNSHVRANRSDAVFLFIFLLLLLLITILFFLIILIWILLTWHTSKLWLEGDPTATRLSQLQSHFRDRSKKVWPPPLWQIWGHHQAWIQHIYHHYH